MREARLAPPPQSAASLPGIIAPRPFFAKGTVTPCDTVTGPDPPAWDSESEPETSVDSDVRVTLGLRIARAGPSRLGLGTSEWLQLKAPAAPGTVMALQTP